MKTVIASLIAFYSLNLFANVNARFDISINGKKVSMSQDTELDKKYVKQFDNMKIEYTVSEKKPLSFPAKHLWGNNSIYLKAQVYDAKGNIISSPEVTTVLGKKATLEEFKSQNTSNSSVKMDFTATKI